MKNALLLLTMMALSGCALLMEPTDRAAEKIGEGITYYCENVTPALRQTFRDRVNFYAAPNVVAVQCAASGEILTTVPDGQPSE